MKNLLYALLSLLIIMSSCTIQKRVHLPGYQVEWKNNWNSKNNLRHHNTNETEIECEAIAKITPKNAEVNTYTNSINSDNSTASIDNAYIEVSKKVNVISVSQSNNIPLNVPTEIRNQENKVQVVNPVPQSKSKLKHQVKKLNSSNSSDLPMILIYLLAIFIPFVAVGIVTDWDGKTVLINILWTLLCGIPGIIHAFIIVSKNS